MATATAAAPAFEKVKYRAIITICAMLATLMQALDSTIANVALPYMQGSLSATYDQITWVLTSYITAAAIMTAPVGWMAARFGRKNFFMVCLVGFTAASMLCGVAQSLPQMVAFRLLQGIFGAALVPLSQAVMLDIYSPAERGSAMALWGMGVMVGPILGPTLGGYLTELYNWRYVFFVNLPFGIIAIVGMAICMPRTDGQGTLRFDWIGFGVLAMGIGALQLMLDRGSDQDWFNSSEILIEATLAGLGIYLFVVHLFTAEKPFISPSIFRDQNFSASLVIMFALGMVLLASSALLAPWLQNLGNYPVEKAGLLMAPRGAGTMIAMMIGGRLASRVDPRLLMALGIALLVFSLWTMTTWTPDVSQRELITNTHDPGRRVGIRVHPAASGRLRHHGGGPAHRRHRVAQPVPQCRQRHRRVADLVAADPQRTGRAFGSGGQCQPVQPGLADLAGDAPRARSADGAWGGDDERDDRPAGADHCL